MTVEIVYFYELRLPKKKSKFLPPSFLIVYCFSVVYFQGLPKPDQWILTSCRGDWDFPSERHRPAQLVYPDKLFSEYPPLPCWSAEHMTLANFSYCKSTFARLEQSLPLNNLNRLTQSFNRVPRNLRVPRVAARGSAETDQSCPGGKIRKHHSLPGFHEQRKHLPKVALQQKGWKTLAWPFL